MIARLGSVFVLFYALGFVLFAFTLGKPAASTIPASDAAVVLTGGKGRIEHAIDVLRAAKAKRLLIAGADPSVTKADLARRVPRGTKLIQCCVDLGSRIGGYAVECRRGVAVGDQARLSLGAADHQRLAHAPGAIMNSSACWARAIGSSRTRVRSEPSFITLFGEYNKYVLRRVARLGRHLTAALRSAALCGAILSSDLAVGPGGHHRQPVRPPPDLGGRAAIGSKCTIGCSSMCSRFASRVEGAIPPGPHLIAVKHQSILETTEMVRIGHFPVIVIKRELADLPFFGTMTRRYGVIPVERSAGAKALRVLVAEGKKAVADGRSVIIYPEGTRVRVGDAPKLKSGFAALYRALGLPVVPVAVDSGRLWGRGLVHRPGTVTLKVGESSRRVSSATRSRRGSTSRSMPSNTS